MVDTLFRGNQSAGSGGGLAGSFDVVTINDSQFISNTAVTNGGALQSFGNIFLTNALFQENHSDGSGGGLYTSGSVFLTDSDFLSNTAGVDGGGAFVNSNTDFNNGRFQNNSSGARGGGMYSGSFLVINGTEFINNSAGTRGGGGFSNFDVTFTNGRFQNNTAGEAGGGVFVRRRVNISQTMFISNQAQLGGGLAISGTLNGTLFDQIDNTLFAQNQASVGGAGLYMNSCGPSTCRPLYIFYITIASPTPTANQAILVANGNISVTNAILANHGVGMEKGGGGTAVADFINYFDNTTNEMGVTGTNLVLGNSAFVSANDYRLVQGSAAMDAGTDVGISVDIRGFPRPTGAGFDIGAYEGSYTPTAVTLTSFSVNSSHSYWLLLFVICLLGLLTARLLRRSTP
jgi:predicted outer membrane repeat protein